MAKESGVSESALNNAFRKNYQPTIPRLEALCKGLGITITQFFADGDEAVVLSEEQREMLKVWDSLNKEQKAALLELLKIM